MKLSNIIYAITLFISLTATTAQANEVNTAIKANNLSFEYALNTGNAQALTQLYTDDAVVLPPTDETLARPELIRQFWEQAISDGISNVKLSNFDIRIEGDTAYQALIWSADRTSNNGETIAIGGNMINVFIRQADGSWKPRLQSWN